MIKGTVCLFVACLGVISLSLPAVAVPTVYEYMTGAGFGSGTIASIEGTEIFESQSSTGILKAAVDFAVFSPDVYGSDIEIVPAAYWESGLSPDSDNYLYAYRIRNLGDTENLGLTEHAVSHLILHINDNVYDSLEVGYGSPEVSDNSLSSFQFEDPPTGMYFDFSGFFGGGANHIQVGHSSGLMLLSSPYSYSFDVNTYPATIGNSGLTDIGILPISIFSDPDNDPDVTIVPAPGAFLLGGIGVSLVGWIKRRRSF